MLVVGRTFICLLKVFMLLLARVRSARVRFVLTACRMFFCLSLVAAATNCCLCFSLSVCLLARGDG